jgi:PAS domain S-box-containing protein
VRLAELLDMSVLQRLADANYVANGMPIGIVDAHDGKILAGEGWQDICARFHRVHPVSLERCKRSDDFVKAHASRNTPCEYKCENGLRDIALPIFVAGEHLATLFLGQFMYEGEARGRDFFARQAQELGYDVPAYLAALDRVPQFSHAAVENILTYDKALALFIADLAEGALRHIQDQQALRESKEQYRTLFTLAPSGVVLLDTEGRILAFNEQAHEQLGYTRDEFARLSIQALDPDRPPEVVREDLRRVAAQGGAELEVRHRCKSGEIRNVAVRSRRVDGGHEARLLAVWQDITERKQAEGALRRSEARVQERAAELETILEAVPAAVMITHDREARGIESNRLGHQMMQVPVGRPISKSTPADAGPPSYRIFQDGAEILASELPLQVAAAHGAFVTNAEFDVLFDDGSVRHLLGNARPFVDASGNPSGAVGAFIDVTDLKRAQAQLMQSDRLASVGMLAAGVAHEINNPLTYVIASLEALGDQLAVVGQRAPQIPLEDMLQALEAAREGAQRVKHVVRDLKTFSRVDEGHRAPIDLRRVIDSAINVAFNEIKYRARLVKDYGASPAVLANEARLGQVFLNLVVNAAQAIPEGDVAANEIRVTTSTDQQGRAVAEVRDTGSGIPRQSLHRIFEPFFTTKPKGIGTGLGLAICRNIIAGLGGEILVESAVGEGTIVRVVLPPAPSEVAVEGSTKPVPAPAAQARRSRVLVIDDEPSICGALRRILGSEHEVHALTSARQGCDRIAQGDRFDVILCDLMMPEMTGMDLHAEVSALAPDQAQRIVLITGGAFTEAARDFLARVPNARIEKPFDSDTVRAVVRGMVA